MGAWGVYLLELLRTVSHRVCFTMFRFTVLLGCEMNEMYSFVTAFASPFHFHINFQRSILVKRVS